ncbi:hypothetical protein GGR20_000975 [Devosia subaequoris]|uniref:Uncharacterized protein n=1 Tax=Devosia subaequoris TaxID=395930 RepID=A0A7W6NAB8_9HYPH|nr:hypothetical protein [Devosia subaequoris]
MQHFRNVLDAIAPCEPRIAPSSLIPAGFDHRVLYLLSCPVSREARQVNANRCTLVGLRVDSNGAPGLPGKTMHR